MFTGLFTVIFAVISPSILSVAVAPASVYVDPSTVETLALPTSKITGGVTSAITAGPDTPSITHKLVPFTPSSAMKYNLVPTCLNSRGFELPTPTLISLTITVPAVEPSLVQSSVPFTPSSAEKYSIPPTSVRCVGSNEKPVEFISFTNIVPTVVPSLIHNCSRFEVKNNVFPTTVKRPDVLTAVGGIVPASFTTEVPTAVPSLTRRTPFERP